MTEEEIIQTLENMIKSWNNIREDCKNSDLSKQIEQIEKENKAIQGLLDLYNKQKEELEIEKRYSKFYENIVKEYKKICIQKNKEIEELKQEIKDITCIPQDDIRYDEDGNELLED